MNLLSFLSNDKPNLGLVIICFIAFSIPLSIELNGISLILLCLYGLTYVKDIKHIKMFHPYAFFMATGLILFFVPTILYSDNFNSGINILVKKLSLLIIPLFFSLIRIDDKVVEKAFLWFVISCFLSTIICWVYFYFTHWQSNPLILILQQNHFRGNFAPAIHISPTYLTIFLLFSILILIQFLIKKKLTNNQKLLIVALIIFFLINALLLTSRMPLFAFALLIICFSFVYFIKKRSYFPIIFILILIGFISIGVYNSSWLNYRFVEVVNTQLNPPTGVNHNSTNLRVAIFNCAMEGLSKNWLFGVGVGDLQAFLNQCYFDNNYSEVLYQNKFNVHNMYLDMWLTTGILGFIFLISSFGFFLYHAIKKQDFVFASLLILFCIVGLTEALFNTQRGIVFFAFFNSVMAIRHGLFYSRKMESNNAIIG